jgi:hypothetical protein
MSERLFVSPLVGRPSAFQGVISALKVCLFCFLYFDFLHSESGSYLTGIDVCSLLVVLRSGVSSRKAVFDWLGTALRHVPCPSSLLLGS